MRHWIIASIITLMSFNAQAEQAIPAKDIIIESVKVVQPFNRKVPYEINIGNDDDQALIKVEHQFGFYTVNAKLKDGTAIKMLIDTGADVSILSQELVKKLNLKPLEELKQKIATASNRAQVDTALYIIDELILGEAHIRGAPFIVSNTAEDDFQILSDLNVEGILGINLFHDLILTLDFPNSQIILSQNAKTEQGQHVPLNKQYYLPVIKSKVAQKSGTKEYDFLIDTGYTGFVKMPVCFKEKKQGHKQVVTYDVFNQSEQGFISELDGTIQIGDKVLENPLVKYSIGNCSEPLRWGLIGSNYLKYQTISIDQRKREVIIY